MYVHAGAGKHCWKVLWIYYSKRKISLLDMQVGKMTCRQGSANSCDAGMLRSTVYMDIYAGKYYQQELLLRVILGRTLNLSEGRSMTESSRYLSWVE
jgi:hypothetical protein